jgi:hypothetical protein
MVDDDGGPAFPGQEQITVMRESGYTDEWVPVGGMTLRDYFAAAALQGVLAGLGPVDLPEGSEDRVARVCFIAADAMLHERQK